MPATRNSQPSGFSRRRDARTMPMTGGPIALRRSKMLYTPHESEASGRIVARSKYMKTIAPVIRPIDTRPIDQAKRRAVHSRTQRLPTLLYRTSMMKERGLVPSSAGLGRIGCGGGHEGSPSPRRLLAVQVITALAVTFSSVLHAAWQLGQRYVVRPAIVILASSVPHRGHRARGRPRARVHRVRKPSGYRSTVVRITDRSARYSVRRSSSVRVSTGLAGWIRATHNASSARRL